MQFHELLKVKLANLGITQAELFRRTGIPSTRISKYVRGKQFPRKPTFDILCKTLGITDIEISQLTKK